MVMMEDSKIILEEVKKMGQKMDMVQNDVTDMKDEIKTLKQHAENTANEIKTLKQHAENTANEIKTLKQLYKHRYISTNDIQTYQEQVLHVRYLLLSLLRYRACRLTHPKHP